MKGHCQVGKRRHNIVHGVRDQLRAGWDHGFCATCKGQRPIACRIDSRRGGRNRPRNVSRRNMQRLRSEGIRKVHSYSRSAQRQMKYLPHCRIRKIVRGQRILRLRYLLRSPPTRHPKRRHRRTLRLGPGCDTIQKYTKPEQRKEMLDLIAYRKNAKKDAGLSQGVAFFAFLRKMTCDGYYTSKVGIADLQYIGNVTRSDWLGCPPLPE